MSERAISQWTNSIHEGDALDILEEMPAGSAHAVVTDPPYGLAFMGKSWDDFEPKEYQEWCEKWAREAKRVLKPGGHLLAFSGNRTHHRLFTGVEDAGLEVRDTITWHYSSGFPKSHDVSKAIDKAAGELENRETVGVKPGHEGFADRDTTGHLDGQGGASEGWRRPWQESDDAGDYHKATAPATDAAAEWDGWMTALKPATEFVVVARKPFDGTVAENVREHGTGAFNVDACRIQYESQDDLEETEAKNPGAEQTVTSEVYGDDRPQQTVDRAGRYPANVVFDEGAARDLDGEVGQTSQGHHTGEDTDGYGNGRDYGGPGAYTEPGGPSRYFYTSKASKAERTLNGQISNGHPTVKPLDLMEWLVQLVAAEGQVVLDPFCGTGTTCKAAKELGRRFVGIEQQAQWADVARARCGLTPEDPSVLRGDDEQHGLETFAGGEPRD